MNKDDKPTTFKYVIAIYEGDDTHEFMMIPEDEFQSLGFIDGGEISISKFRKLNSSYLFSECVENNCSAYESLLSCKDKSFIVITVTEEK